MRRWGRLCRLWGLRTKPTARQRTYVTLMENRDSYRIVAVDADTGAQTLLVFPSCQPARRMYDFLCAAEVTPRSPLYGFKEGGETG